MCGVSNPFEDEHLMLMALLLLPRLPLRIVLLYTSYIHTLNGAHMPFDFAEKKKIECDKRQRGSLSQFKNRPTHSKKLLIEKKYAFQTILYFLIKRENIQNVKCVQR